MFNRLETLKMIDTISLNNSLNQDKSSILIRPLGIQNGIRVFIVKWSFGPRAIVPVEAYDVLISNVDPTLRREPAPETPAPLLERFSEGLTTQEVAALLVRGNNPPDPTAAEVSLLELVAAGRAIREPLGDGALWRTAGR